MQQSVIFCLKETRCSGSTLMALECIKVLPRNTFHKLYILGLKLSMITENKQYKKNERTNKSNN